MRRRPLLVELHEILVELRVEAAPADGGHRRGLEPSVEGRHLGVVDREGAGGHPPPLEEVFWPPAWLLGLCCHQQ
eukprot:4500845-Lingulodinium_polyedra.AAC.1